MSDVWHGPPFPPEARQPGVDPDRTSYGSFCSFINPEGNTWLVRVVTTRLPGRIDDDRTAFGSTADLASALRRGETAHAEHEKRTGHRLKAELAERVQDENCPAWYAEYIAAEQAGTELPS